MTEQQDGAAPDNGGDARTFTQEQVNALLAEQKRKVRSEFADYDDIREKASKFDQFEESRKTDEQRNAERLAALEKEATTAKQALLRTRVAAAKGVPEESLTGETQEDMEKSADGLIAWRDQAARSGTLNPTGGFFSGSAAGDTDLSPKQRAAAALRSLSARD